MKLPIRIPIFFFLSCCVLLAACQKPMVAVHLPPEEVSYSPPRQEFPQIQAVEVLDPVVEVDGKEKTGEENTFVAEVTPETEPLPERKSLAEIFSTDRTDLEFASLRRKAYSDKINRWQTLKTTADSLDMTLDELDLWQNCIDEMGNILSGYEAIANGMPGITDFQSAVLHRDISFSENRCELIFADTVDSVSGKTKHYSELAAGQAEKVVSYYDGMEDYESVISNYRILIGSSDRNADYQVREMYGHALQRAGRLSEAADVLLAVADSRKDAYNWKLRLHAAEILIAVGDFGRALEESAKVAEIFSSWSTFDETVNARMELLQDGDSRQNEALSLYAQALHAWMTGDGKEVPAVLLENTSLLERKYSGTIYAVEAERLRIQVENSVHAYVLGGLDEVEALIAEKEFNKAQAIIDSLRQLKSPGESEGLVASAGEDIKQAESAEKIMQQRLLEESIEAKWQQANLFFDQKEYDKAIDLFRELMNSEYRKKAIRQIDKAAELAAADMRKKAAFLFSKSRRVNGVEKKSALLLESRSVLKDIILRYPEAKVIDKVVVNLQVIEEEIYNLDPSLLDVFP